MRCALGGLPRGDETVAVTVVDIDAGNVRWEIE